MSRTHGLQPPRPAAILTLAVALHGALLLSGSYQRTYDAYVHMFFADHYVRDWFSTWDERWYTGFTVVSYPPGTHQLMALLARLIGLSSAFMLVQLCALLVLVIGVYRFALLWVDERSARWAALLAVLSTSIAEAVHVFGQLPTTASLGLLLNVLPFIDSWLRQGRRRSLLVGMSLLAATTATHHVTVLFGSVFFLGPVAARAVIDHLAQPTNDETVVHRVRVTVRTIVPVVLRRAQRVLPIGLRLGVLGVLVVSTLVVVVLPYWMWSQADPISQVPIPHASRENFLVDTNAGLVFWLVPWGPLLLIAPLALIRSWPSRNWPLAASVSLLALLGTGGTTPIPRLLLGGAFDILTLDRFTFWATIAVLPLAGTAVAGLIERANLAMEEIGLRRLVARAALATGTLLIVLGFLFSASLSRFRTMQPDPIDPDPIAEFMAKDQHDRWRYLTLGFGDQMAWVSAHTTATTVDGNYHSVRRLPELVSRAVERLEGAKYRGVPGVGSLQQFLVTPQRYSLKFVFSNDEFYDPLLFASGWQRLGELRNDVMVWERADVPPLPAILPRFELPTWQRLLWGLGPMAALISAAALAGWNAAGTPRPRWLRTNREVGAFTSGRTRAIQR
ncbi:MAG: hypothetical protein HKN26_09730, partial [Acidimicrobiales bacterium]|nr:hypothetical protein [Acidimicrobiales bacterium]